MTYIEFVEMMKIEVAKVYEMHGKESVDKNVKAVGNADLMEFIFDKIEEYLDTDEGKEALEKKNSDVHKTYGLTLFNFYNWYVDCEIVGGGNGLKDDNLLKTISDKEAIEIINTEYGFEMDAIQIIGKGYFEAYDFNHIVFVVKGYPRVMKNGSLFDILW